MRKKNEKQEIQDLQDSVYAQLLASYGIAIVITVISFFLLGFTGKAFGALVSSVVPTTITFLATALFEYKYILTHKMKHAWYILLTIGNALLYAAFLCVDVTASNREYGLAAASFVLAVVSVFILIHDIRSLSTSSVRTSDGDISGKRR